MKWRSRGPREDWAADEDTSNEGFNPGATSPPCLFHPRLPISLSHFPAPFLCYFLSISHFFLLCTKPRVSTACLSAWERCYTVLQYVAICECVALNFLFVCTVMLTPERWGGQAGFFGRGLFVATKHDGPHRGLSRLNPLTLKEVLCL